VRSILLGTDGACVVEPQVLDPLREDERVFANPDHVRRRLAVIGRSPPGLADDTTVVLVRAAPLRSLSAPEPPASPRGGRQDG